VRQQGNITRFYSIQDETENDSVSLRFAERHKNATSAGRAIRLSLVATIPLLAVVSWTSAGFVSNAP
jgi:hypothetical protein